MIEGFNEYFLPKDEIGPLAAIIDGPRIFRIVRRDEDHVHVASFDPDAEERSYSRDEIKRRQAEKTLLVEEGYFDLQDKLAGSQSVYKVVGMYPAHRQVLAIYHLQWAQRLQADYLAGKTSLTDKRLRAWSEAVEPDMRRELAPLLTKMGLDGQRRAETPVQPRAGRMRIVFDVPGPTTLRDNRRKLERAIASGCDVITEFLDDRDNCDQGGVRIDGEIRHLITQVDTYGDERNATYTLLRKRLKSKLDEVNAHRTVPLKLPAPSTFNAIVNETPAIRNLIGRKGINHARQQLTIVGEGPRYTRVGEMIEMDCWEMHVMSIYKATGAWALLDEEVKDALGPIRIWIAVALDVASGCILGIYFSATESTAAALGALRMVFEDKSWLAAWAGCQRDWLFPIGVDCVQTDGGSVFKTADFWVPALSCIPQVRKKAGDHKRLNGHVERLFGTMDRGLMPNFSARTFSNTVQLGDYKPE